MAKYNAAEVDALGKKGHAFKNADGHHSFPIADEEDLKNAIQAVGMSNDDHDKVRKFIMGRAIDLGLKNLIPENWAVDGSLKDGQGRSRKPRLTGVGRLDQRRRETRAAYREDRENRTFAARLASTGALATRGAATVAGDGSAIILTGTPTVYSRPYEVQDQFGVFVETVAPGALTQCLKTCDTRFLFDHKGLPLARVSAGTLTLVDTKEALTMTARMDSRIDLATALALAIQRGDLREMSIGMKVGDDIWNLDYTTRTITRIDELYDCSAVTYPASPTTSIECLEQDELDAEAGPDGTLNQSGSLAGVPDNADGAGRSRNIDVELALANLSRPILGHTRARPRRPVAARARRTDIDQTLERFRRPI